MPAGTHGVVLDATGRLNNVYAGRPEQFEIRDVAPVRDYATVTLHVARASGTGKTTAKTKGEKLAKDVFAAVAKHYGDQIAERKVLVVVGNGKDGEDVFKAAGRDVGFAEFAVTHWGRVDGRNDWRDFDTLLIATLPYGTTSTDLSTYMAVRAVELDDESLNAPPADVKVVRETRIAAQLAQAVGRIRLRTMTREDGTCEPCDVFIRLPNWDRMIVADRMLDAVCRTLPGAKVVEWTTASNTIPKMPKRAQTTFDDQFIALVAGLPEGQVVTSDAVCRALGRKRTSKWWKLANAARDPDNPLHQRLVAVGGSVRVVKGAKAGVLAVCRGEWPAAADALPERERQALDLLRAEPRTVGGLIKAGMRERTVYAVLGALQGRGLVQKGEDRVWYPTDNLQQDSPRHCGLHLPI